MSKNTNFTGQPIFGQLLMFMSRPRIHGISAKHDADRYVKKLTTYKHVIVWITCPNGAHSDILVK
ncbi:MAG: DUF4372 domain-containing protein [Bacteroidales bacterium]